MGFWDKSLRIFNCLCENGTQSVRRIAQKIGLSKSSVHRLQQAMARRGDSPEAWLWEREEGRRWLTRLVVATLYTFSLKRGVGLDTISEFFAHLRLESQIGCSPTALRGVMQTVAATIMETAAAWEDDGVAAGEVRDIIGAVDETFLEHMMLVFQDVSTGYLLLEEVAADRTYATWKAVVDKRLEDLRTGVVYLVSDRAQALMQLAEKGLGCLSIPDFFHFVHEIVKSYSLAIGRRLRQAQQERKHAEKVLERRTALAYPAPPSPEAEAHVEAKQAEVTQWEEIQRTYRHHLETLSLTLHPFRIADSVPQCSAQVERQLYVEVEALAALVGRYPLPERPDTMRKVRKQIPALAALVDFWWQGVGRDLEPFTLSPSWRQWVYECLLPMVYWDHQVARTRCRRRKARLQRALAEVQATFTTHAMTQRLAPQVLAAWQAWATDQAKAFQRASSAVEGRNGSLAQLHHNQRGLPQQRYKVWTALHNFDCHALDGTTPAARFFRRSFPDLFETVLARIDALPRARQRKRTVVLSH